MWFMAVYSKAWLLLLNTGSSLSLREEDSSLRSGSTRLRQLLHGMGSISHRFTMPTDHWRKDLMPDGMVERMSLQELNSADADSETPKEAPPYKRTISYCVKDGDPCHTS